MQKEFAFFPWIDCPPTSIGSVRLLPYRRRKLPGTNADAAQDEIDAVLGAYADRPRNRIVSATMLEVDNWRQGQEVDDTILERLFRAKEALSFSALSKRRLFYGHPDYCNADNFRVVVQPFLSGAPTSLSYRTRRRDGGTLNGWGSSEFAFRCPLHVYRVQPAIDNSLVHLLMETKHDHWLDAVVEFNLANTDSGDVAVHTEMVMMKSAFERLLRINEKAIDFTKALKETLHGVTLVPAESGDMLAKWAQRWDKSPNLLDAWAHDFCASRGSAAHGKNRRKGSFVWSQEAHLAFASILFPLLFKTLAADQNDYELTEEDTDRLRHLEHYIAREPFITTNSIRERSSTPWAKIERKVCERALVRAL